MRRITVSKTRPDHWPEVRLDEKTGRPLPMDDQKWEDVWGKHLLKDGLTTTERSEPYPVLMPLKRKYRG